jgi:hypothetical protein
VVNDRGEILVVYLSPGNVDDREPIPDLTEGLFGKEFADKGYLSHTLFLVLWQRGLPLFTGVRKNMPTRLLDLTDKLLLRQRAIIETIHDH